MQHFFKFLNFFRNLAGYCNLEKQLKYTRPRKVAGYWSFLSTVQIFSINLFDQMGFDLKGIS